MNKVRRFPRFVSCRRRRRCRSIGERQRNAVRAVLRKKQTNKTEQKLEGGTRNTAEQRPVRFRPSSVANCVGRAVFSFVISFLFFSPFFYLKKKTSHFSVLSLLLWPKFRRCHRTFRDGGIDKKKRTANVPRLCSRAIFVCYSKKQTKNKQTIIIECSVATRSRLLIGRPGRSILVVLRDNDETGTSTETATGHFVPVETNLT